MAIVSITELRLNSLLNFPRFVYHAFRTKTQSQSANGNLKTTTTSRGLRYQYTMTLWKSREAMIDYKKSGAHREAIRVFPKIATGRVCSFEGEDLLDWDKALEYLEENGRTV